MHESISILFYFVIVLGFIKCISHKDSLSGPSIFLLIDESQRGHQTLFDNFRLEVIHKLGIRSCV